MGIRSVVARAMGNMAGQARAMVERDGGARDDGTVHSVAVAGSIGADACATSAIVVPSSARRPTRLMLIAPPALALHRNAAPDPMSPVTRACAPISASP